MAADDSRPTIDMRRFIRRLFEALGAWGALFVPTMRGRDTGRPKERR